MQPVPRRYHGRLLLRALDLLAALDVVALVDRGGVLLAGAAVDGFLLAVLRVDRVVAVAPGVLVHAGAAGELVVALAAIEGVVALAAGQDVVAVATEELVV